MLFCLSHSVVYVTEGVTVVANVHIYVYVHAFVIVASGAVQPNRVPASLAVVATGVAVVKAAVVVEWHTVCYVVMLYPCCCHKGCHTPAASMSWAR